MELKNEVSGLDGGSGENVEIPEDFSERPTQRGGFNESGFISSDNPREIRDAVGGVWAALSRFAKRSEKNDEDSDTKDGEKIEKKQKPKKQNKDKTVYKGETDESVEFNVDRRKPEEPITTLAEKLFQRFAPKKLKNYFEALDVSGEIENSPGYGNFEDAKDKLSKALEARIKLQEKESNLKSDIKRVEAELGRAKNIRDTLISLASGENDLISKANQAFSVTETSLKERLDKLNPELSLIEGQIASAVKIENTENQNVEGQKQSLRDLLDLKIERVEERTGISEIIESIENQSSRLQELENQSSLLDSRLKAYRQTLEFSKNNKSDTYSDTDRSDLTYKIKAISTELESINKNLAKARENLERAKANKRVIVDRIQAIDAIAKKMDFDDEVPIPAMPSDIDAGELKKVLQETKDYRGKGVISGGTIDKISAIFTTRGGGGGGGLDSLKSYKKEPFKSRRKTKSLLMSIFSFFATK